MFWTVFKAATLDWTGFYVNLFFVCLCCFISLHAIVISLKVYIYTLPIHSWHLCIQRLTPIIYFDILIFSTYIELKRKCTSISALLVFKLEPFCIFPHRTEPYYLTTFLFHITSMSRNGEKLSLIRTMQACYHEVVHIGLFHLSFFEVFNCIK